MNSWELAERLLSFARLVRLATGKPESYSFIDSATTIRSLDLDSVGTETLDYFYGQGQITGVAYDFCREVANTGTSSLEGKLFRQIPKGITNLNEVEGLKPATVAKLYDELGIETIEELKKATQDGLLVRSSGFGARFSKQIDGMVAQHLSGKRTLLLTNARHLANLLVASCKRLTLVSKAFVSGDIRRGKETIDRIDIICVVEGPSQEIAKSVADFLGLSKQEEIRSGFSGEISGVHVRVHLCKGDYLGSAICATTGPADFYQKLCARARHAKRNRAGYLMVKGDEELFFSKLGLPFLPPEIREWPDAIELSEQTKTWDLVEAEDILGDLHVHTDWSDGRSKIGDLVKEAESIGLQYFAVTDHASGIEVARGLGQAQLGKQLDLIRKRNSFATSIKIIPGIEFNIDQLGGIDYEMRHHVFRLGAIHKELGQDKLALEMRYLKTLNDRQINTLAHPTVRKLLVRPPLELDWETVFSACALNGVFVELNYAGDRLDPPWQIAQIAVKKRCKFTLGGDIHHFSQLRDLPLGVQLAKRAGIKKEMLLNCEPYENVLKVVWRGV